jgi:hypothetical protein
MIFMATPTSDSQRSLIPQQSRDSSLNQIKESSLKVNIITKDNDSKNKQSCLTNDKNLKYLPQNSED